MLQLLELEGQAGLELRSYFVLVTDQLVELLGDGGRELIAKVEVVVLADDSIFDEIDWQVRQIAEALLTAAAEVVGPSVAVAAFGNRVDEAGFPTGFVAALAEEQTLEVVVVLAIADPSSASEVEYLLDLVEEIRADQSRMAPRVLGALVFDDALVVRVMEHLLELADGHR